MLTGKTLFNYTTHQARKFYDRLQDKRITLGVTGLSGSGKSSFITSLVYQLLNHDTATLPSFSPVNQGRFLGCRILHSGHPDIPLFDFHQAIDQLSAEPPCWPSSTTDLGSVLLEIKYRPRASLLSLPGKRSKRLFIEIRDYPGEWLLDLPLLSQSYYHWSVECAHLLRQQPRRDLLGNLQPLLDSINPMETADPEKIRQIHEAYVVFLERCKSQGLSLIQPGRFLLPGNQHIQPFVPAVMAVNYEEKTLDKAKPGSYFIVMKQAYEDYIRHQVKPFYHDYFSDIDRQVILVDVLKALNLGKYSFEDMRITLSRILDSFHYGHNSIVSRLFSPKISKVVLAASKIDQVLPEQHENVRALTSAIVRDIHRQTSYEQVDVFTEAFASVRCTETVQKNGQGYLQGTTENGQTGLMWHPVIPDKIPSDEQWQVMEEWQLRRLSPPRNPGLKSGEALPHVRMDTVIRELIGDKF